MRGDEVTVRAEVELVIEPEALIDAFDRMCLMSDTAPSAVRPLKNFANVRLLFSNKHNTNG